MFWHLRGAISISEIRNPVFLLTTSPYACEAPLMWKLPAPEGYVAAESVWLKAEGMIDTQLLVR